MATKKTLVIGIIIGAVVVVGAGAAAIIAAQGRSSNMDMGGTAAVPDGGSSMAADAVATDAVAIKGFAFTPDKITVKAGTTVTWTNNDAVKHSVTSDDGQAISFDSGLIASKGKYTYTFDKPGTYTYYCTPHPYMKASVVVTS